MSEAPGTTAPASALGVPATRLGRESATYAIGSVVGKAIGFVMLPVLTRFLDPTEFGRLDVLTSFASVAISVLSLGFDVAAVRHYFESPDPVRRRRLLGTYLALAIANIAPVVLALFVLAPQASQVLLGDPSFAGQLRVVAVIVAVGTLHLVGLTILRASGRPGWHAALSGGGLVANAALAILLLQTTDDRPSAVLAALAITWGTSAMIGLGFLARAYIGRPEASFGRALLRLALPLAPAVLVLYVGDVLQRILLLVLGGAAEVAFLSVALRYASVAALAVAAFQLAWQPRAYSLVGVADADRVLAADARRIVLTTCGVAAILGLAAPEVLAIASGPGFERALPVSGVALAAILPTAFSLVAGTRALMDRRVIDLTFAHAAGLVVSVATAVALAPAMGARGSAAALLVGQCIVAAVLWYRAVHNTNHAVPITELLLASAVAGVVSVAATSVPDPPALIRAPIAILVAFLVSRIWLPSLRGTRQGIRLSLIDQRRVKAKPETSIPRSTRRP